MPNISKMSYLATQQIDDPVMSSSLQAHKLGRLTYSCIRCANRKVKCDRQRPCSACIRHKVDCVYNIQHPLRKKSKRVKVKALTDQLNHYENLLQEHGIDHKKLPQSQDRQCESTSSTCGPWHYNLDNRDETIVNKTQVVDGQVRFRFVENSLWTKVVEESHDAGIVSDDSEDASISDDSDDEMSLLFRSKPSIRKKPRHPPSEQMEQLWKIFTQNVDPLTKIVHVPTLQPAFRKALQDTSEVSRDLEALLFSIYSTAIISIDDDECKQRFSEPQKILSTRYVKATEAALSRANFMATLSLVVLQALVFHLTSVREIYEPRAVWSLTGVAVRIAQVMGLERDGEQLGLPLFETEMRRRVWWQLKLHDFRTAELCGLAKFRDLELGGDCTKWPTRINDNQLHPAMTSLEDVESGITDSVVINLRCELTQFASKRVAKFRREGKDSRMWNLDAFKNPESGVDKAIKELEESLELKYIRHCDPCQPLHLFTVLIARYAMNTARFLTHHPRGWTDETPDSARQEIWNISVKLLEQHIMAKSNPTLKRYYWHSVHFQQWHSFIHVLDVLRANPLHVDADRVWDLISSIYEATPAMVTNTKKPIYVAVGSLCMKAYAAREAALQSKGYTFTPPVPAFIQALRQNRAELRAKQLARSAKSKSPLATESPLATNIKSAPTIIPTMTESETATSNTIAPQTTASWDTSPPSFMTEFRTLDSNAINAFEMELDVLLAMDCGLDGDESGAITWEQWDAWLNESNNMRPMAA